MMRPEKNEYDPFYEAYISLVNETEIIPALQKQIGEIENLFAGIPEDKGEFAYAEGKWTIKQLAGHLIDAEKILAYRALRIARGDKTPIEGFEQEGYIENGNFNQRKLADLAKEFALLRQVNLIFFQNLSDEAWARTGTANNAKISVRALAYILVGHVRHHTNVLKTRYLDAQ